MAEPRSLGEALSKGGPVIFTGKDMVPQLAYAPGKEAEALKLLELKGIVTLLRLNTKPDIEPFAAYGDEEHTWLTSAPTA